MNRAAIINEAQSIAQQRLDETTHLIIVPNNLTEYTITYMPPFDFSAADTEMPKIETFTVTINEDGEFPQVILPDGTVVVPMRRTS